jgi:hypothetical protein
MQLMTQGWNSSRETTATGSSQMSAAGSEYGGTGANAGVPSLKGRVERNKIHFPSGESCGLNASGSPASSARGGPLSSTRQSDCRVERLCASARWRT